MKALKFNLSGQTAFFKKPDVNSYVYFTYSNIHKVALLGILGSILGLKGYNHQDKKDKYPEFYEKLKDLKISIVPKNINLNKKIQVFNNSVGYASQEQGGNLIVKEQWLENPSWDIYIFDDSSEIYKELEQRLLEYTFVYLPYLGKNDHIADIKNPEIVEMTLPNQINIISSLINDEIILNTTMNDDFDNDDLPFKLQEILPLGLDENINQYISEKIVHTNFKLELKNNENIYKAQNEILYFM